MVLQMPMPSTCRRRESTGVWLCHSDPIDQIRTQEYWLCSSIERELDSRGKEMNLEKAFTRGWKNSFLGLFPEQLSLILELLDGLASKDVL